MLFTLRNTVMKQIPLEQVFAIFSNEPDVLKYSNEKNFRLLRTDKANDFTENGNYPTQAFFSSTPGRVSLRMQKTETSRKRTLKHCWFKTDLYFITYTNACLSLV